MLELDVMLTMRGLVGTEESFLEDEIMRATGREAFVCAWLLTEMLTIRRVEERQNRNSLGSLSAARGEHNLKSLIRGTLKGFARKHEPN
jgi:hypothetical protein